MVKLQAWLTRIKNKDEILRQLEEFPVLLANTTEKWRLYLHDEKLKNAVHGLCETVMDSLSVLVRILLRIQDGSCEWQWIRRR